MSGTRSKVTCTAASDKPTCGSEAQTCRSCRKAVLDTRETVVNGLRLIRIRFRLPYSECPDLEPSDLNRYLSFLLLQGQKRASVAFPRRQSTTRDSSGFLTLSRMGKRARWEFAHSVASIKRNLPQGCRFHTPSCADAWKASAFSNPPPSSPEYLSFLRREVRRMFPFGWDRDYEKFVYSHVPNATARFSEQRADHAWMGEWKSYVGQCLSGPFVTGIPFQARYKEVLSAGKVRPLIIYDKAIDYLAPLHKMLYKHLSKQSWCLVGPPTSEKISSVCRYRYQTSIDLVSATDNLSLESTEAILASLLSKCERVPGGIRELAHLSLRPLVTVNGVIEGEVTHGQMMGAYLSFPLLCLQSYLAARWAMRGHKATYLVNGDDCLVSSDAYVSAESYPSGWKLNDKKTIRSEVVAEVNSTAFLSGGGKWREVRHLRRGGFQTDFKGMLHIASAVRGSREWTDAFVHSRIGKKWGFLPSQLSLHPKSYPAFSRGREMWHRCHTPLPLSPSQDRSEGILGLRRALDPDERMAFTAWQWSHGRDGGRKRDVFSPSVGEVRRTYAYKVVKPRSRLSFVSKLKSLKFDGYAYGRKEVDMQFVPDDYMSIREMRAIREQNFCFPQVDG
ncbi:RNA dependent RNA polymerase [Plasmopara viticola lesion associated ourmia-like virus 40]|uniref:RNA dependent RNA polymerase n=1 Tax=Plasmopara viticola lesion associated ourmia-like virus 40 TaxID=2686510 RepID=A0ABX6FIX2_9VIRU|nr:RNA dependent RNA polymerase [Plasmopara viticola lesion associated ourmia-like virus 40]QGY72570.1 RNA dependent RNA polymerase [Plasmopara viticola lesion associated ourmia-like virus 40]